MVLLNQKECQVGMNGSDNFPSNLTLTLLTLISIIGVMLLNTGLAGSTTGMEPTDTKMIYGCVIVPSGLHCDKVPNRFSSIIVTGKAIPIYQVVPDSFEGVPGKLGNALELKGYIGE